MSGARRLIAAVGAGVLALLAVAPPAFAAPSLTLTGPSGEPPVFDETGEFDGRQGVIVVQGAISADNPIESVSFAFDPPVEGGAPGCEGEIIEQPAFIPDPDDQQDKTGTVELVLTSPCNRTSEMRATIVHQDLAVGVGRPAPAEAKGQFSVAIPPRQVRGLRAGYDAATREVRLDWAPNPEPDLIRYYIERDPEGRDPVTRIGEVPAGGTSFVDPNVGGEFRYQVTAVRRGAGPGEEIEGDGSLPQKAGVPAPGPTVPDTPPPATGDSGPPSRGAAGSSSGGGGSTPRSRAPSSNIFEETLPFDPSRTTTIPADRPAPTDARGDAAVLAEFDDGVSDEDQRRATLVPVAGGLALIVGALHLFLLSRRAGESDIPIVPR